jgi:putative GTP pyrophosphokinase
MQQPNSHDRKLVQKLVDAYKIHQHLVEQFQGQLLGALAGSPSLSGHIHSIKSRLKDPEHLRDKLFRKIAEHKSEGREFEITPENLFIKINDLAGIRILHLYTHQIRDIDAALRGIFDEQRFALIEGPFARTWDDESREFLEGCGIQTQKSPSMYTSVHYVVNSASRTTVTCEIQVRTLMEEVWGEVDHSMNYPHKVPSLACQEQLKVLARVTSSATRLVDSIFLTLRDFEDAKHLQKKPAPASKKLRTGSIKKSRG